MSPEGLPTRRRWGRFAVGTTLSLLGAWIFAAVYVSAGERIEVLALDHDVEQYHTLTKEDFRTVRVAADPGVRTVKAGEADDLVGRVTRVPIVEGTLLAAEQLLDDGQNPIPGDKRGVPLRLKPGRFPPRDQLAGMRVDVVIQPPNRGEDPETIENAWIRSVGEPDENTGERNFEVVVPEGDYDTLASADDTRVKLVAQGSED